MNALPIDPYLDPILKLIRSNNQVILTATPGAGKTTRLPSHLLKAVQGKVAVLQPRRLAAISACQYVCQENNWTLGKEAGYQVRLDSQFTKDTRLLFMTDALLLRRLIDDPELKNFDLIVIDEFHERNLNQDLILGLIKELQEMGSPIKLLIMSATLNLNELNDFLPKAKTIEIPGKVFPLHLNYSALPLQISTDHDFIKKTTEAILLAHPKTEGNILVFLPGKKEIYNVEQKLKSLNFPRDILTLHGSIPLKQQQQVLSPKNQNKVILATNIAEASITVPGVNYVIDTGLSRILNTNLNSGFSKLDLTPISLFNADQRAGRAARQSEGTCHRLWTTFDQQKLETQMPPEALRSDLSQVLLLLSLLGVRDFLNFSWLTPPSKALVAQSEFYLKSLNALDADHSLTDLGKRLLAYPINPRWGALLIKAEANGGTDLATSIAALLQAEGQSDLKIRDSTSESDLSPRLENLKISLEKKHFDRSLKEVIENKIQLSKVINDKKPTFSEEKTLLHLLLHTQVDRLCKRRQKSDRAVMIGGRGVRLAKDSNVKTSDFFLALQGRDNKGDPETLVSLAHGVSKEDVLEELKDKILLQENLFFDENKEQFFIKKGRYLYDLEIDEPILTPAKESEIGEQFIPLLQKRWDYVMAKNLDLKDWMARWKFYVTQNPKAQGIINESFILKVIEHSAIGVSKISEYLKLNLTYFFESEISTDIVNEFKQTIPESFKAPSGKSYRIQYLETEAPFVEIRIQELFGLTKTPKLGPLGSPLVFKLLAPNYRPMQVTTDIAGFWKSSYFEIRKELRNRYPKHPWPEDPLTASPVKK